MTEGTSPGDRSMVGEQGSDVAEVAQHRHETSACIGTIRGKVWKGEDFPAGSWLRTGTDSAPAR